ncbi:unnamed protein product, partial [Linum tenue]
LLTFSNIETNLHHPHLRPNYNHHHRHQPAIPSPSPPLPPPPPPPPPMSPSSDTTWTSISASPAPPPPPPPVPQSSSWDFWDPFRSKRRYYYSCSIRKTHLSVSTQLLSSIEKQRDT